MPSTIKTVIFWMVIFVSAILLWQVVRSGPQERQIPEIAYSQFMSDVDAGNVASVTISGTLIRGEYRDGKGRFRVIGPANPAVYLDSLHSHRVEIHFQDGSSTSLLLQLLGSWAPLILLAVLWFFMIRQMQRRKSPASSGPGSGPIEPK